MANPTRDRPREYKDEAYEERREGVSLGWNLDLGERTSGRTQPYREGET